MSETFWQRLDKAARSITPFGLTLFLVILSVVPMRIPGYAEIAPVLALMSVYHWAIYRPDLMPLWSIFVLGVLQDLLSGVPLGLYILVFLTVYGVVLSQRRFFAGRSFLLYWLGFGIMAFCAAVESWVLASLWHLSLLNFETVFFQFLLSMGIFPFVAWVFLRWQQALLGPDQDVS